MLTFIMKYLFVLLLFISSLVSGEIGDRANSVITGRFGAQAEFEFQKISLENMMKSQAEKTAGQYFFSEYIYATPIIEQDSILGYAFLDNVKGKSMPITFLVLYDTEGTILQTEVMKYRETIGGEISHPNWLKQFIGLADGSAFKVGKNIDGISGATISVRSMNSGIHKLTLLFEPIKRQLK